MALDTEKDLDAFIERYSDSPFTFSSFLKNIMYRKAHTNETPIIIIVKLDQEIIGAAPLLLMRRAGIRYCQFLIGYWSSSDFVINDKYRQTVINHILNLLFKRLNCKFADLHFSYESPNFTDFRQVCISNNFHVSETKAFYMDHWVIPVNCSWAEFQKSKGRFFGKEIRLIERKLNAAGKWKLVLVENDTGFQSEESAINKVMAIDRLSWKALYRQFLGQTDEDDSLIWFLKSSSSNKDNHLGYRRKIWFLELDNLPIAYILSFHYGRTAFFVKSSFIEKYRKLSPGKFVNKAAIMDIFDKKEVQRIDFMANFPFVRFWGTVCLKRVRLDLGDGLMFKLLFPINKKLSKVFKRQREPESSLDLWLAQTAKAQLASVHRYNKQRDKRAWLFLNWF